MDFNGQTQGELLIAILAEIILSIVGTIIIGSSPLDAATKNLLYATDIITFGGLLILTIYLLLRS